MSVKTVRNVTLALESNVRYYYFEAELTEDVGNWVEMKMKKSTTGENFIDTKCLKRSDNSTYSTDDTDTAYASRDAGAASVKTVSSKVNVGHMVGEWASLNSVDTGAWRALGWEPNKS
tara:strand:+ start:2170 stop:2523 length:354 start_codon:yes stop_codon:yes gene_type:complete